MSRNRHKHPIVIGRCLVRLYLVMSPLNAAAFCSWKGWSATHLKYSWHDSHNCSGELNLGGRPILFASLTTLHLTCQKLLPNVSMLSEEECIIGGLVRLRLGVFVLLRFCGAMIMFCEAPCCFDIKVENNLRGFL